MKSLYELAQQCIAEADPTEKVALTHAAAAQLRARTITLDENHPPQPFGAAGSPAKLQLVRAAHVAKRSPATPQGRAALIHAIAHIEFNAINLAWDAAYRFRGMPEQYYDDWVKVADEEAQHFTMLRTRLLSLGYDYGDFSGHGGLWDMAGRTANDVLERMALVPRVFEARGLDATPGIIARLRAAGDEETCAILDIILRDEVGHVAIGTCWFHFCCAQRNLEPEFTFQQLIKKYFTGKLRGPFHYAARKQAGFTDSEMQMLENLSNDEDETAPASTLT